MCVRDDDGAFVLTKTMRFSPLCLVNVGEALGLFHALQRLNDTNELVPQFILIFLLVPFNL